MTPARIAFPIFGVALACAGCAHSADPQATRAAFVPAPIAQFRAAAYQLDALHPDPRHIATIAAMRQMALALDELPVGSNEAARIVEDQANRIESSPLRAHHTQPVRTALTVTVEALGSLPNPSPAMLTQLDRARSHIAKVDPETPYLEEREAIDLAFVAVANAMALAGPEATGAAHVQVRDVRVNRYVWNTVGPNPETLPSACGATGARTVATSHDSRDILAGVFTLGIYTPMHVRVLCRTNHVAHR